MINLPIMYLNTGDIPILLKVYAFLMIFVVLTFLSEAKLIDKNDPNRLSRVFKKMGQSFLGWFSPTFVFAVIVMALFDVVEGRTPFADKDFSDLLFVLTLCVGGAIIYTWRYSGGKD